MAKPNLEKIIQMMEKGSDFKLTSQQYKKKTNSDFPKYKSYAEKRSAVAKKAQEYGYRIEVVPQQIKFLKVS